jgi:hypothetical protein
VIGLQGSQGLQGVQSLRAADLQCTQLTEAAARNEAGTAHLNTDCWCEGQQTDEDAANPSGERPALGLNRLLHRTRNCVTQKTDQEETSMMQGRHRAGLTAGQPGTQLSVNWL